MANTLGVTHHRPTLPLERGVMVVPRAQVMEHQCSTTPSLLQQLLCLQATPLQSALLGRHLGRKPTPLLK